MSDICPTCNQPSWAVHEPNPNSVAGERTRLRRNCAKCHAPWPKDPPPAPAQMPAAAVLQPPPPPPVARAAALAAPVPQWTEAPAAPRVVPQVPDYEAQMRAEDAALAETETWIRDRRAYLRGLLALLARPVAPPPAEPDLSQN